MTSSRAQSRAERFAEYDKWVGVREAFPAIASLGKAWRLAGPSSSKQRDEFVMDLRLRVDPNVICDAAAEAIAILRRIMHILSIGTKFDEDELLLVLTLRIQIELVAEVLTIFCIDAEEIALRRVDEELREIAKSKENRRAFASAFGLLKKNCGIPVENQWAA
jgi:hypothetical protein